ncbi:MAG: hypothetical protein AAGJ35_04490 [Myxococcota bacterium]
MSKPRYSHKVFPFLPWISLGLLFLAPYFLYQSLYFLDKLDYLAATLTWLSGLALLKAGVDLSRSWLSTNH